MANGVKISLLAAATVVLAAALGAGAYFLFGQGHPPAAPDRSVEAGPEETVGFGNDLLEGTIVEYLLTQPDFSWQTAEDGRRFCVVENLGRQDDLFSISVWAYCGEFALRGSRIERLSGFSGPALISYPNELSFYDVSRFSHQIPRDGALNAEDIRRIFPDYVRRRLADFRLDGLERKMEALTHGFLGPQ